MHRKRRRKIKYLRLCISILIIGLVMSGAYKVLYGFLTPDRDKRPPEEVDVPLSNADPQNSISIDAQEQVSWYFSEEELYSPYAILVRLKDQQIVFQSRSEDRIYPASLTKIMTTIVAIENVSNLQKRIVLPEKMFSDLYKANASIAGFLPGEEVAAIDLLYGTLLPSGADASIGLALQISGSEEDFVKLMNEKAKELGMEDTHFRNVSGLHADDHYTTVKDMAELLVYALQNEIFREIFTSERHATPSTNLHSGGVTFSSTLSQKTDTYKFEGGEVLGGKTGYTKEAGLCLATLAEKNGVEYILVTAGAAGDHNTEQYHVRDAFKVYGENLKE